MRDKAETYDLARDRLLDYLAFKGVDIGSNDPFTLNLNDAGFDAVDWGILIGEIQCDTMMMLDWSADVSGFKNLNDIASNMRKVAFTDAWSLHHAMVALWDRDTLRKIVSNAGENIWEC